MLPMLVAMAGVLLMENDTTQADTNLLSLGENDMLGVFVFYTDLAFPFVNYGQQGAVSEPMSMQFKLSDN